MRKKKWSQEDLKKSQANSSNVNDPQKMKIRQELITHNLTSNQKMELYKATIEGRVLDFKFMVLDKGYNILEEVSAANFYWTPSALLLRWFSCWVGGA